MHRPDLPAQRAALARVEALEAQAAALWTERMLARAEVADLWADDHAGYAEMELAGTALIGQYRAARELSDGVRLRDHHPVLVSLTAQGLVHVTSAELLLRETARCTPQVQAQVDARVSPRLIGRNSTDARRLVLATVLEVEAELDPQLTRDRQDDARAEASVWVRPGPDGLTAIGAAIDAVAGRRWALDFQTLVKAQTLLDTRDGTIRSQREVELEVFASLPTLELTRAAHDGRLTQLTQTADLDPDTTQTLHDLTTRTVDLPLPDDRPPPADTAHDGEPEIRVETDPYDHTVTDRDCWRDLPPLADVLTDTDAPTEPDPPEPLPGAWAAQDAATGDSTHSPTRWTPAPAPDATPVGELLLRCLRLPLPRPVLVNIHVPMATALDLTDAPGVLDGHGPLDARRIRTLLPAAHLRTVWVHEHTGVPLGMQHTPDPPIQPNPPHRSTRTAQRAATPDQRTLITDLLHRFRPVTLTDPAEPQHDPSAALTRFVKLRDVRCSGPGCTMPASRCDLDHETPHPHGPTAEWNLANKSRRCHTAKHHDWTAQRLPDGTTTWTSPTGRSYTSHPQWQPPPTPRRSIQLHPPPTDHLLEIDY